MTRGQTTETTGEPRVLMLSLRRMEPKISRTLRFEFEDVARSVDRVRLASPRRNGRLSSLKSRAIARLDGSLPRAAGLFGSGGPAPGRTYDLLFVGCRDLLDLRLLAPLAPWRAAARFSICYIDELYESRDLGRSGELAVLRRFDGVFTGCQWSVPSFSKVLGRPCRYLPFSVDALAFCPYPDPPARVIDFYAMGRRPPGTHEALMRMGKDPNWFYLYDTTRDARYTCRREHRRRLAALIQRSRYFLVNVGKANALHETGGQEEIGFRYFEGAAAGCVMIGEAPRTPSFEHLFGWPDAVVPLPYDSRDIADVIRQLEADPARVERIRRANVANSLRRHDHVYRWGEVLSVAGLKPTPAMERRIRLLDELARTVEAPAGGVWGGAAAPTAGGMRSPNPT